MIVTFFNKKGGTGKTSLAFSVAKDLNYYLISNDDSVIEDIYPDMAKIVDNIEVFDGDVVYDLGGFLDPGIIPIFKNSDVVIVPTTLDISSLKRTQNTVKELEEYCKNIVIVVNKVKMKTVKKYFDVLQILKALDKDIIYIRESEAVITSTYKGLTITELYNKNALSKYQYKGIYEDYKELITRIKK